MTLPRGTRYARAALRRAVSRRTTFRGPAAREDGRITLLTVDYHATFEVKRLVRSFHRFVDPSGPVVVVQNGSVAARRELRSERISRCVGGGVNFGHGLGLDYGMRQVSTQYTLICDPDSAVVDPGFRQEILARVELAGAASIDNGAAFYHPVCLAFSTDAWKRNAISFEERWPDWDVAGQLTDLLGGLRPDGLLPRTRAAGPPLASTRAGHVHFYGEVYGDVFTNTYGMSRKVAEPAKTDFEGWPREEIDAYHRRWRAWASAVVDGTGRLEDFPTSAAADGEEGPLDEVVGGQRHRQEDGGGKGDEGGHDGER